MQRTVSQYFNIFTTPRDCPFFQFAIKGEIPIEPILLKEEILLLQ
jgi:hypothetical protein